MPLSFLSSRPERGKAQATAASACEVTGTPGPTGREDAVKAKTIPRAGSVRTQDQAVDTSAAGQRRCDVQLPILERKSIPCDFCKGSTIRVRAVQLVWRADEERAEQSARGAATRAPSRTGARKQLLAASVSRT